MGEEFYAIIKLVSGEEIFSLVSVDENDGDPIVILQDPITMKLLHNSHGTHIKIKSWIELSTEDFFILRPDKIITMSESKDPKLIAIYTNYLEEESDFESGSIESTDSNKTKPTKKMGYISSVESARKKLEDIFKLEVEDTKES
jgi:hypothetical protein